MDTLAYIESGILELYALNQLDELERLSVEDRLTQFPEIAAALKQIQFDQEAFAIKFAIEPRTSVRNKIERSLSPITPGEYPLTAIIDGHLPAASPAERNVPGASISELNLVKPPTPKESLPGGSLRAISQSDRNNAGISLPNPRVASNSRFYVYAMAACLILLVISSISLVRLTGELHAMQQKYAGILADSKKYASEVRYYKNEAGQTQTALADSNTIALRLKGTPKFPGRFALVLYNRQAHTVLINSGSLLENDKLHSYQLWAIVDGKPISAGVFDVQAGSAIHEGMKSIVNPQAFAVTEEPAGGSESPHLDQMVAMAKI